jgi:hypothetical protein
MYYLYVIRGSHACRWAMLMLEHKQLTLQERGLAWRARDLQIAEGWA